MKKLNILFYAIIAVILVVIILLIFVQSDFRDFVRELDQKNVYLYREDGKIIHGFTSPPYEPLSEARINSMNSKDSLFMLEPLGHNYFYFNKQAIIEKEIVKVEFIERIYSKEEAIALLDSAELTFESKTHIFASLVEHFESDYIFAQFKEGNIVIYPHRLLWKFVDCCPVSLTKFFSFKREVGV